MRQEPEMRQLAVEDAVQALELQPLLRLPTTATMQEAARALRDANVSSALVGSTPRAIVTERDLVDALARGMRADTEVAELSTSTPIWLTTTSTIEDAARMMLEHQVRHLVVIEPISGHEIGVLSIRSVIEALLDMASSRRAHHVA